MPLLLTLFIILGVFNSSAFAQRLPVWELGAAVGVAQYPYYRGAAARRNIILPLPLAMYRGEKYTLDKDGARRWLFKTDRLRLDLSLAAGLPVPSGGQVKAREDMPRLNAVIEFGPVLDVHLWRTRKQLFSLHLPLRAAVSLDWLDSAVQGVVFSPFFNYSLRSFKRNYWEFHVAAGPQFGSQQYHDYYYGVGGKYATAERSEYAADYGYSGSRVTVYANKRLGRLWMSAFARYDYLDGAVFEDSPLVEKKTYLIGGFVIGWIFVESPRKVTIRAHDW